jgi:UDP-N-acetylmuramoyl-L-alanine---L-glutamate ligase
MKQFIDSFKDKRILILGFGREGESTYRFLRRHFPNLPLSIADQQEVEIPGSDQHIKKYFGNDYLEHVFDYDVIIKTPGIKKTPILEEAEKNGAVITSQTKLFFSLFRDRIIGVTGTKGKSTTASLIYQILKKVGRDVVLLGNIGIPAFDYIDQDIPQRWYVFELSAHQLSDVTESPHIAVFLNLYREHLDYYRSFEEYHSAKKRITVFQNNHDILVFNEDQKELKDTAGATLAKTCGFSQTNNSTAVCYIDHDAIVSTYNGQPETIIALSDIPLLGSMNRNNVMAAILVAQICTIDPKTIETAIRTFIPLEYRLELVGTYYGIQFYDDALATIPEATIQALESFPDGSIDTLIAGGFDRGQDFGDLAKSVIHHHIHTVILFPTTGDKIWEDVSVYGKSHVLPEHFMVNSMEEAVRIAYQKTETGKICLLSPASPSFGMFKDYRHRSEEYRKYIELRMKN